MLSHVTTWLQLKTDRRGVTAIEYGMIAALIAVVIAVTVTTLGSTLASEFGSLTSTV